jgi:hypothetical protein
MTMTRCKISYRFSNLFHGVDVYRIDHGITEGIGPKFTDVINDTDRSNPQMEFILNFNMLSFVNEMHLNSAEQLLRLLAEKIGFNESSNIIYDQELFALGIIDEDGKRINKERAI